MASTLTRRGGLAVLVLLPLMWRGVSELGTDASRHSAVSADETVGQQTPGEGVATRADGLSTRIEPAIPHSDGAPGLQEDRPVKDAEAEEARLERARHQRLRRNLARLERAAETAELDGNPAYAQALRARAESIRDLHGS